MRTNGRDASSFSEELDPKTEKGEWHVAAVGAGANNSTRPNAFSAHSSYTGEHPSNTGGPCGMPPPLRVGCGGRTYFQLPPVQEVQAVHINELRNLFIDWLRSQAIRFKYLPNLN